MFIAYTLSLCPALVILYFVFPNSLLLLLGSLGGAFFFLNLKSCSFSSILNSISSSITSSFSSSRSLHSTLISSSPLKSKSSHLKTKSSNSSHNFSQLYKSINISFFNIRFLNKKSIHVFNLLSDSSLDLLALIETWHESASPPFLISACPTFYSFLEFARASQNSLSTAFSTYGGICFFFLNLLFHLLGLFILVSNLLIPLSFSLNMVLSSCSLLSFIDLFFLLSLPLLMTPLLNFYILFPRIYFR